jgi:glycerate dehydrogenase
MRLVVLDGFSVDQGELRWDGLARHGDLVVYPRTTPEHVRERAEGAVALFTNKVVVTASDVDALRSLRYIGIVATGTNVVDAAACRAHGVAVTNVPGYAASAVAEHVFAMLLQWFDTVEPYRTRVKQGGWAESPDYCFFLGRRQMLHGKTLAVLGMGSIGRRVAEIGRAFGMEVIAAAVPGGASAGRVPLATALSAADVVTLHCPLTEHTRALVDRRFFGFLKRGAVLVNTSRGGLVDEAALAEALLDGRLGAALLDVLSEEPPRRDHPLLDPAAPFADRVVVTPHIAWGTVETRSRLIEEVAENFAAFRRDERRNRVD